MSKYLSLAGKAGKFLLEHNETVISIVAAVASMVAATRPGKSIPGMIRIEIHPQ